MSKKELECKMSRVFEVLGNPLKYKIFLKVFESGKNCNLPKQEGHTANCVSGLMKELDLPQSTVSMYMKDLEEAELIECIKKGKFLYCRPNKKTLLEVKEFTDNLLNQLHY